MSQVGESPSLGCCRAYREKGLGGDDGYRKAIYPFDFSTNDAEDGYASSGAISQQHRITALFLYSCGNVIEFILLGPLALK